LVKTCPDCSQSKPISEYYKRKRALKYPDSISGYQTICKPCFKKQRADYVVENKEKCLEADHKRYQNSDKTNWRASNYRIKFGISLEDYNRMFDEQEGKCKICKRHQSILKSRLAVDHNHSTGKIRGLLCRPCNSALGLLKENIDTLSNCIEYLINSGSADTSEMVTSESLRKVG
jgi:hypothetical protein